MKEIIKVLPIIWMGAAIAIAQAPRRNPIQSPASQPRPQTATSQTYAPAEIKNGEARFRSQCAFCHGRDAAGGETGPDLTRSKLVAEDVRGDKIVPLLREGRMAKGMPAFELSDAEAGAIVAFMHDQKTKFETMAGGRRAVDPADLATGDVGAGKRYFNGAGGCSGCHSPTGDLAGVASRYRGWPLLQRMLAPSTSRPNPAPAKVTVTLASGETVAGTLAVEDEFSVTVLNAAGARQTYQKSAVKFKIDNPIEAHFNQLGKYTDADIHNVYAYLETLK